MKKRLIKKLSLNKQTIADLHSKEQANVKAGAELTYVTCEFPVCVPKTTACTGITCQIPTGCVPAEPTECSSPSLSEIPWPCPC